ERLGRITRFKFFVALLQSGVNKIAGDIGDGRIAVVLGEDNGYVKSPQQSNESRGLETVVAHLDHMTQRVSIERLRQQFKETAKVGFIEFLEGSELPEEGAEPAAQLCHARVEKALDRVPGLREHAAINRIARALHRKNEILRNFGSPFAKRGWCLCAIERA